jgi:hypothetical protein
MFLYLRKLIARAKAAFTTIATLGVDGAVSFFVNIKSWRNAIQHNDISITILSKTTLIVICLFATLGINDTRRNDTQHNDTQHNDTQHNDNQHKTLSITTLSITTLSVMAYWRHSA